MRGMLLLPTSHRLVDVDPMRGVKQAKWTAVADVNRQTAIVIDASDTPNRSTIANHYL
jgi:hypothetical protein